MLATEREDFIRNQAILKGVVYVNQLAEELKVSRPTIRSDIDKLAKKYDDLHRVHGGVTYKEKENQASLSEMILGYNERIFSNRDRKKEIAEKAIDYIVEGETILLDSSSTCFEFASLLSKLDKRLTVITNGLSTAAVLKQNPSISVIIIGGLVKLNSNTVYDEFDINISTSFNIDKYFFSASGVSIDNGFSEFNFMEVKHKRLNVLNSKQTIALIDSTKFLKDSSSTFCKMDEVNLLITDSKIDYETFETFNKRISIVRSNDPVPTTN
ncbi:DeoR/GlpR family DNA-binding transcription regulator [Candidatus Enterococcus murrayae]|uniref:DeoR/GlpR transcriptional regulator n=1 Tax=Candidatus Enterococcus murrayae TaxID=2815321 RepID=A0ABS3HLA2_9ENTE|nr:DeoR/GlpR family DNA-binding transcription regulator [Enterococcus sp. MJM16]MBO0454216.1 DeoR/GlpR transcriptional regulator [Enterococcus sp. MJM16]